MADVLGAKLAQPEETSPESLAEYDLIGFGSGIYFGKHHRTIRKFVDRLPAMSKDAFVFSTGGAARDQNGALVTQLKGKGLDVKGSFYCTGFDTFGPFKLVGGLQKGHPDEKDLENARVFARSLTK
jgi:flavodoxin